MSREIIKILNEYPSDFPRNSLPTNADIIKAIYFKHHEHSVTFKSAYDSVSKCIQTMWERAGIPVIAKRTIDAKIENCFEKFRNLLKYNVEGKGFTSKTNQFNVSNFISQRFFILFYIFFEFLNLDHKVRSFRYCLL